MKLNMDEIKILISQADAAKTPAEKKCLMVLAKTKTRCGPDEILSYLDCVIRSLAWIACCFQPSPSMY